MHEYSLWFMTCQLSLLVGFILGRISRPNSGSSDLGPIRSSFSKTTNTPAKIKLAKIDESKFVTKVSDTFVKNGNLGTNVTVDDNIDASVSKLAQLKKNK